MADDQVSVVEGPELEFTPESPPFIMAMSFLDKLSFLLTKE